MMTMTMSMLVACGGIGVVDGDGGGAPLQGQNMTAILFLATHRPSHPSPPIRHGPEAATALLG